MADQTKFNTWEEAVLWLRSRPDQQDFVRACYYDDPLDDAAERFYHSTEWTETRKLLPEAKERRVLDIGAGMGIASYALARDGWKVVALEPDSSPVVGAGAIRQLAQRRKLAVEVIEEKGEAIPLKDSSFDLVFGRQVLHHAIDLTAFCREICRVLRKGGCFVATREHVIDKKSDLRIFLDTHPLHKIYGGENAFLLSEYVSAIQDAGLTIVKILGHYDTDINLFPRSLNDVRERISKKLHIAVPEILFRKFAVPVLNRFNRQPGMLYTFAGVKQ